MPNSIQICWYFKLLGLVLAEISSQNVICSSYLLRIFANIIVTNVNVEINSVDQVRLFLQDQSDLGLLSDQELLKHFSRRQKQITFVVIASLRVNQLSCFYFVGWFVGFVALRPKSTAMVIAGRSVHLTTLFPGQA